VDAEERSAAMLGQRTLASLAPPVRGLTLRLAAVLTEAAAQSETFRGLIARIGATDGIVYIAESRCGPRLPACLLHTVTISGQNRLLRILVDPRKSDRDLMASLAHELQHAVEVLSERTVRSDAAIRLFFRARCTFCNGLYETDAAVLAGHTVRDELRRGTATERRE
jgi:hypothetical protein